MSRKRLLVRGVVSSYGALAAQIFYSLASIPLVLAYTTQAEFGMWGLITTLMGYLGLFELGMTNAVIRHLFECRDSKEDGRYGRLYVAGAMALGVAGALMLVIGIGASFILAPVFHIPAELRGTFFLLMIGNVVVAALSMATRILGTPLYVHQRQDLLQASQIFLFILLFSILFLGLKAGWGIYAMLANVTAGMIWSLVFSVIACRRLRLYPPAGTWAKPLRSEWKSILTFSRDMFTLQVGTQIANSIPVVLIPRLLGLEAAAIWTVCTRPFNILRQATSKPYECTVPILCEMFVKGDRDGMASRWGQITQLVMAVSVCVFAVGAANNQSFIHLWVGGKIAWPPLNDWLVAAYFLTSLVVVSIYGLAGMDKNFGMTKYISYIEGAVMIVLALVMTHWFGIAGLLVAAILSQLLARVWVGLRYLSKISNVGTRELFRNSFGGPLLVLVPVVLIAAACGQFNSLFPGYVGLAVSAITGSLLTGGVMLAFGVSPTVREELSRIFLKPFLRFFNRGSQQPQPPV